MKKPILKSATILLFSLLLNISQAQSVLLELEDIKANNDLEKLEHFFEDWHQFSLEERQNLNLNDTVKLVTGLYETIIAEDTKNRFTFSKRDAIGDIKYFIPHNIVEIGILNFDWDIPNEVVVFEELEKKRRKELVVERKYTIKELKEISRAKYFEGLIRLMSSLKWDLNSQSFSSEFIIYPQLQGFLSDLNVCYLIGEYRDFSRFIGNLNHHYGMSINKEGKFEGMTADSTHHENADFIRAVATGTSAFRQYPWAAGISHIHFNNGLTKAMVYPVLNCYTGFIPYFYEKENGVWVSKGRYWEE